VLGLLGDRLLGLGIAVVLTQEWQKGLDGLIDLAIIEEGDGFLEGRDKLRLSRRIAWVGCLGSILCRRRVSSKEIGKDALGIVCAIIGEETEGLSNEGTGVVHLGYLPAGV
jgi:hypothetical protein